MLYQERGPIVSFWKRGQRAKVAALAGISQSTLSDILHRRRGVSGPRAMALSEASEGEVPVMAWFLNRYTKHPAFFGDPVENQKAGMVEAYQKGGFR